MLYLFPSKVYNTKLHPFGPKYSVAGENFTPTEESIRWRTLTTVHLQANSRNTRSYRK